LVVRDMSLLAKQYQVGLVNLTIESTTKTPQALAQLTLSVQTRGDYVNLKRWVAELQVRHAWLAVKSLDWRSTSASGVSAFGQSPIGSAAPIEASFIWVLYVQD
jgi:hypothetical protein